MAFQFAGNFLKLPIQIPQMLLGNHRYAYLVKLLTFLKFCKNAINL